MEQDVRVIVSDYCLAVVGEEVERGELARQAMSRLIALLSETPDRTVPVGSSGATWKTDGFVQKVDCEAGTITLNLSGFTGGQTVEMGETIPEWMRREGAPFRTTVLREVRSSGVLESAEQLGEFSLMPYADLNEYELLMEICEHCTPFPEVSRSQTTRERV